MSTHKPTRIRKPATLEAAAPMRYVHSMGKRLKASEWSDSMKKTAHEALVAWNKP